MNISDISLKINQNIFHKTNVKYLSEGQSVRVQVLAIKKNGQYEGSVGGVKVSFTSKNPLNVGESFVATVTNQNRKIILMPEDIFEKKVVLDNIVENKNLSSLLGQMGLPQTELAVHLLKQFKQLHLPFEPQNLNKLYSISLKIKGKEKKALEILALLLEKNIFVSETELVEMIKEWDLESDVDEQHQILNKFNNKPGSWYIFPFDMVENYSQSKIGSGNIKLFFNYKQEIEKINIICNYKNICFLFNLEYFQKKLEKISFNISDLKDNDFEKIKSDLYKIFNEEIKIFWKDKNELLSTECSQEVIQEVKGEV